MQKFRIIAVHNIDIFIATENNDDYICLTDMVKGQEGDDYVRNWMRNRYTIEFLGLWEMLFNPKFKGVEFDTFLHEAAQQQQLSRLNAIDAEKSFRKLEAKKVVVTQNLK